MSKNTIPLLVKTAVCVVLAAAVVLGFVSCKPKIAESKPADVDYYTCTMHPSVHSQVPGKCPICSMDLVPVMKKVPGNQTNAMSGMETGTNLEAKQLSEFTIPVERQQQIGVTFGKVENHHFHHTIRAVGAVAYDKQRHWDYVARVDGYVQQLSIFSRGESVEKNAPLLTLYSPDLLAAQNEFVNVLKSRDDAKAKGQPAVLDSAEQLVAAAKQRLHLWNITDEQISELEKNRKPSETLTLYSPFKGVVQDLLVDQGRQVKVGDHLVDIVDLSGVWVWAQFYQEDLPMLKQGLPVTVTVPSRPGEKFNGKISVVDPFVNDALRTVRVRIDVDNPNLQLRPDMYVNAELSMDMGEALAVSSDAVLPTGLHNIVFVDKGSGRLEPRFAELGREYGNYYEVKSGLKENERVVTSANFLIDAEAKVQGALKEW